MVCENISWYDPNHPERISPVREWTAKLRLKQQLHARGDHYEVELMALPKAGGITIRYTTDGSAPTSASATTYEGPFRVPDNSRIVCAIASAFAFGIHSEITRIAIPQKGKGPGGPGPEINLDPKIPARYHDRKRFDDASQVWDLIGRTTVAGNVTVYDIDFTAESSDKQQHIEFSGALASGYDGPALKIVADRLQVLVGAGSLRMNIGSLGFQTGQALLDWLKANNQAFDATKVKQ